MSTEAEAVTRQLSRLDRFLPVWIGLAMLAGLLLGSAAPRLNDLLDAVAVGEVSLPIALGLLLMCSPRCATASLIESPATGACWSARWCSTG